MRLFIAIPLPKEVQCYVKECQHLLSQYGITGNFVPIDNLHITLIFLGEIEAAKIPQIHHCIDTVLTHPKAIITLECIKLRYFAQKNGCLWYIEMKSNPQLKNLHTSLAISLKEKQFSLETRPFKAHITIGRGMKSQTGTNYNQMLQKVRNITFNPQKISLFTSERYGNAMKYTAIYTKELLPV